MAYIGRLGIGVRGADRPGFFDEDQLYHLQLYHLQLYHLQRDPREMKNLAYKNAQTTRMKEMCSPLQHDYDATSKSLVVLIGRPFGEFIPGGNAAGPSHIDTQIEIIQQREVKGKTVTVTQALKKDLGVTDEPVSKDNANRVEKLAKKPNQTVRINN